MKEPLEFGDLTLEDNVIYAPLAGCSDYPFRKMAARYKPALMFCEMVKMEALDRKIPQTFKMLDYAEDMHPIGGQICGAKPHLAGPSAKIIEDLGFDVVDLNCGCPVDKVTKDGSGSGLLKNPEVIGEIISNMVAAVSIPVTVKIRAGWDFQNLNAPEITRIAEKAGAKAITVHGRTRSQAYKGPSNWDYVKECVDAANTIKVIGNGDVFTAEAALKMFDETGCDGVLVSRGTFGQPWIAEQIRDLRAGREISQPTFEECRQALLDHIEFSSAYKDEKGALIDMRRITCWYWKNVPNAREFRAKASHATSIKEVRSLIENFEYES